MGELYFTFFLEKTILLIFFIIVLIFVLTKKKKKIIGIGFMALILIYLIFISFSSPSLSVLKSHYFKYVSLDANKIEGIKYYRKEIDLYKNEYYKEVNDKTKIKTFLSQVNISKGIYFRDINPQDGVNEFIALVETDSENFVFEFVNDIEGAETVNFYLNYSAKGLNDLIGKYYLNK